MHRPLSLLILSLKGFPAPLPAPIHPLQAQRFCDSSKPHGQNVSGKGATSVAMENNMAVPQGILHRITVGSSNSTSGHLDERIESRDLNECWYTCTHRGVIHNRHKMDMAQMPISG